MIAPVHHDSSSFGGPIFGTLGYFIGMASGYIPEPNHYWSALITAASSAFVGWVVSKLCNWLWRLIKPVFKNLKLNFWK